MAKISAVTRVKDFVRNAHPDGKEVTGAEISEIGLAIAQRRQSNLNSPFLANLNALTKQWLPPDEELPDAQINPETGDVTDLGYFDNTDPDNPVWVPFTQQETKNALSLYLVWWYNEYEMRDALEQSYLNNTPVDQTSVGLTPEEASAQRQEEAAIYADGIVGERPTQEQPV